MNDNEKKTCYLLLEALVAMRGLTMKAVWTLRDPAELFPAPPPRNHVSVRTIQDWIKEEKLVSRNLPGRGKFLCEDLEKFLQGSSRKSGEGED